MCGVDLRYSILSNRIIHNSCRSVVSYGVIVSYSMRNFELVVAIYT